MSRQQNDDGGRHLILRQWTGSIGNFPRVKESKRYWERAAGLWGVTYWGCSYHIRLQNQQTQSKRENINLSPTHLFRGRKGIRRGLLGAANKVIWAVLGSMLSDPVPHHYSLVQDNKPVIACVWCAFTDRGQTELSECLWSRWAMWG